MTYLEVANQHARGNHRGLGTAIQRGLKIRCGTGIVVGRGAIHVREAA
ncbi:hypothetical protein IM764_01605 [Corynebacterium sp. ED61]|nr:hypothetical protein [Corynebacterium sp. ED61]